jgi:hypothetical protein
MTSSSDKPRARNLPVTLSMSDMPAFMLPVLRSVEMVSGHHRFKWVSQPFQLPRRVPEALHAADTHAADHAQKQVAHGLRVEANVAARG